MCEQANSPSWTPDKYGTHRPPVHSRSSNLESYSTSSPSAHYWNSVVRARVALGCPVRVALAIALICREEVREHGRGPGHCQVEADGAGPTACGVPSPRLPRTGGEPPRVTSAWSSLQRTIGGRAVRRAVCWWRRLRVGGPPRADGVAV
jgi:hypothetical protein